MNGWGDWDRTSEMTESKSVALPLGYTPIPLMVGGGRFELPNPQEQIYSLPRLATSLPSQRVLLTHILVDADGLEPPTPTL